MTSIEHTSPWKKFILTHETTCRNCPSDGFGDSYGNYGNTFNTTYNISGGGFWGGFKSGLGATLGGMLGGILCGSFGGGCNYNANFNNSVWNCGCDVNQFLNPNLAIWQTTQAWNNNCWS